MSVIVGVVDSGRVYLGGDSAAVDSETLAISRVRAPKVFALGELVVGFAGSFRAGQLIRHTLRVSRPRGDLASWMTTDFADAAREALRRGGHLRTEEGEELGSGSFLVGLRGRLFRIESDFHASESLDGFDAIGCGEAYALGALSASVLRGAEGRLRSALEAAERFSAGVRAPFHVVSTGAGR